MARVHSLVRIQQAELALRRARERTEELTQANAALHAAVARPPALSLRLGEVQEDERQNLARELHVQIGRSLTRVKSGRELALPRMGEPVRAEVVETQALLLTGDFSIEVGTGCRNAIDGGVPVGGAQGYVLKGGSAAELVAAVRTVTAGRTSRTTT